MAGTPTRAVLLVAIGEEPKAGEMAEEQIAAYRSVQSAEKVSKIPIAIMQRRNAALEASARFYAHGNFR